VFTFDGVKENPTEREVINGVEFAKRHKVQIIVAVGGGSAMDCAKGINFILTNGGRMADYRGHDKATQPMLPSIGVPTTSGTGSEAQSYALITEESTHMKMACGDKKAAFRVVLLDPELTVSQPAMVTAVTGIDAIAHAVESYVCTKSNPYSKICSQAAWQYLEPNFEAVLQNPNDLDSRSAMQLGAHFAGMAIEASMLGITHSCANPLTAHYGLTHGVAIGILLPHVVRFNGQYAPVAEMYSRLFRSTSELAQRTAELVRAAKLPTSLNECGVSESILPLLAHEASHQWTAQFNPRPVTENELLDVYRSAF
jgi:alcohol dehydrogenase